MTEILKVLIADDETDYLDTLVKRMRKRNVDITGVQSGEAALEWLARGVADVVVLDVKMPGMDGIQTLREIKKRYPLVEVIMLTGHANIEVAIEGMELGAFDYLMKPMEIDELLYKIQDAYKKKVIHKKKIDYMENQGGKFSG
ncbi:MAG: response regulator [Deltaproteobacteria bacterium]|nr:response regulator [Deltaproteobacteria bacterium]